MEYFSTIRKEKMAYICREWSQVFVKARSDETQQSAFSKVDCVECDQIGRFIGLWATF